MFIVSTQKEESTSAYRVKKTSFYNYLDSIENLVHHFNPGVFEGHLFHLKNLELAGHKSIHGYHDYHYTYTRNYGGAQSHPEEIYTDDDLDGAGPDHIDVRHHVVEPLGVHRHEVYDFSNC